MTKTRERAIAEAFSWAGIIPGRAKSMERLAVALAIDRFGPKRRGRKVKWTIAELKELKADHLRYYLDFAEKHDGNVPSNSAVAKALKHNPMFRKRWARYSGHTLRMRIAQMKKLGIKGDDDKVIDQMLKYDLKQSNVRAEWKRVELARERKERSVGKTRRK